MHVNDTTRPFGRFRHLIWRTASAIRLNLEVHADRPQRNVKHQFGAYLKERRRPRGHVAMRKHADELTFFWDEMIGGTATFIKHAGIVDTFRSPHGLNT